MSNPTATKIESSAYWQKNPDSVKHGSSMLQTEIINAIKENRGSLIGRHGTIELTVVLLMRQTNAIDSIRAEILELNAGVFPKTDESIREWYASYTNATKDADLMAAGWYKPLAEAELSYLNSINPSTKYIPLRSLEPHYSMPDMHWTRALEGQRVTVVSSFANTMRLQLDYIDRIWPQCSSFFPSSTQWSFVRSFYSPATANGLCQWHEDIKSWKDAVDSMEKTVLETNPRIVLIGCGALAMPLAHRLKQKGLVAIVLGGAIQLLFGIKGGRWKNHPIVSKFYNSEWVYPSHDEIPGYANKVEGGCYW